MCAFCDWTKFCRGCDIPCNDEPLLRDMISGSSSSSNGASTQSPRPSVGAESAPSSLAGDPQQSSNNTYLRKNVTSEVNLSERVGSTAPSAQQHRRTQSDQMNRMGQGTSGASSSSSRAGKLPGNLSAINIAVDWDPTALYLRYQSTREKMWAEHESVAVCRRQQIEPVDLDHCLRAFTSEERLEEGYHCGRCKGLKPATKKLQIWKLPPIMVSEEMILGDCATLLTYHVFISGRSPQTIQ